MECAKQGFWAFEYWEHKEVFPDSSANHNFAQFAKRQYHKARRRHDDRIIEEQLFSYLAPDYSDFCLQRAEDIANVTGPYLHDHYERDYPMDWYLDNWKEHNHRVKLSEVA